MPAFPDDVAARSASERSDWIGHAGSLPHGQAGVSGLGDPLRASTPVRRGSYATVFMDK
jgi:hypothetical protein